MNRLELEKIFFEHGDIIIKVYYKIKRREKYYYDYSLEDENNYLNGSYDKIKILEFIYFLEEQCKFKDYC